MTTTIEIPGGLAVLRDADDLTERHRRIVRNATVVAAAVLERVPDELMKRQEETAKAAAEHPDSQEARQAAIDAAVAVEKAVGALNLSMQDAEKLSVLQDAAIVALLQSWTLPEPLPTIDTIQDIPGKVYDALAMAAKGTGTALQINVDFAPSPDQTSPTGPSSVSDSRLRDDPASQSTQTSPSVGEPTATESYIPA